MAELLTMIDDMQDQFVYTDTSSMAVVYRANDGKYIIKPAVGLKGLLVNSKPEVEAILKNRIPIDEEKPNPFQASQREIMSLNSSGMETISKMLKKLSIDEDIKFDGAFLDKLNKAINKYPATNLYDDIFYSLGVYIGEYQKSLKGGGKWVLEKRFGYNPYYIPELVSEDGYIYDPWYKLADFLLKKGKKDMIKQLDLVSGFKILNTKY
jgi:hypothetical protein